MCVCCRQLPMLASLLQGRSSVKIGELKHSNKLLLYTHVLGILELLQPLLFTRAHAQSLQLALDAYVTLLRMHSLDNLQIASLTTKFVKFLHNFVTFDAELASCLLKKHSDVLQ